VRRPNHLALASSLGFALCVASARAADPTITVSAGQFDRRDTLVQFTIPPNVPGGAFELRDDAGGVTRVQADASRRAVFILKELKAGQSKTYHLQPAAAAAAAERMAVTARQEGGAVRLQVEGKDVLTYQGQKTPVPAGIEPKFQRGGYIFPVLTPSGKLVADDYPPAHKHHHGIWSPWTKTVFEGRHPDFWNMGDLTGTVEFVGLDGTWSGPVMAGLRTRHRMVDLSAKPEPKVALNETWEVNVYRVGAASEKPYYVFDLGIEQTCAGNSPLLLPKYHYGGLGFRGHRLWDGKDNARFLSSEGKDRSNGNETRGRWCHVGGQVDGRPAGVAILDHPSNFRHPQPMRMHPTEPFFCYAPSQEGDWRIEPGKPYTARYRFVVSDGPPDPKEIDRLWNDFAHPPEVVVK
jgi:hypothetical protein